MASPHLTEEGEGEEGSGPLMLSPPPVSSQPREAGAPGGPRVHLCSRREVDSRWGGQGAGALLQLSLPAPAAALPLPPPFSSL